MFDTYVEYISSMAQWQRAGPITPRSLDRNELLLYIFYDLNVPHELCPQDEVHVLKGNSFKRETKLQRSDSSRTLELIYLHRGVDGHTRDRPQDLYSVLYVYLLPMTWERVY